MSEYFILEVGVRVVDSKPTVVLDLVRYTTNADEVKEVSIETEIMDFHKLMLQDFQGWGAATDVYNAEMRNKRKIRGYQEYGAPISTTHLKSVVYTLDLDLSRVLSGVNLGTDQIRDIHISAFVDSKVEDPAGLGKFTTFMSQLTQLGAVVGSTVRYPKWFTEKLNSEKSHLEYEARRRKLEEAEKVKVVESRKPEVPKAPDIGQSKEKSAASEFIDKVVMIAEIFEGVMETPHSIIVKADGEVDVKLVYKHPRFEELKDGLKNELKYKWRVTEKVWRGTLKDIGKAVRPDFTLKMLLDYIHRNPDIKAQLEDEVKILLSVLEKGGLKYKQPM